MTATSVPSQPTSALADIQRKASLALILATVLWGCGFTWAKAGGEAVQGAADLPGAAFGPVFFLAWRFTLGGIVWMVLFPAARRGWSWAGVGRSLGVGTLLGLGLILQHIGLDKTSEAVSASLTSLTIIFVPLLTTFALRKPPRAVLWLGVFAATAGVLMMAPPSGFGKGELLGLACAFAFSLYILAVNAASVYDTPWRSTGGQFLVVGAVCFIACVLLKEGPRHLAPGAMAGILSHQQVWLNLVLMVALPTLGAFGLLTYYQPRIDPTRAALIYLLEPVIATIYAAGAVKHIPGINVVVGAAMIILTNMGVEMFSARQARVKMPILLE